MSMKNKELLTPSEAARLLKVTPRTITRWCREGKLDGVKVGRLWRLRYDDPKLHLIVSRKVAS